MRIRKFAAAVALGVSALALSACATSLSTQVSRYQQMPAPQGQTFYVVPGEGMAANGGLEFQRYGSLVAQQLAALDYTPAASPETATMIVQLGYGIDRGQVRYVEDPFSYSRYGGSWYRPRFGYGGYGGYWGSPFYYGWDDPFWYRGRLDSYVEYHGEVDLHIRAAATNQPLFDGRAQARSDTNRLDVVLPSLVQALFTGFPGRSGETVRITVPTGAPR